MVGINTHGFCSCFLFSTLLLAAIFSPSCVVDWCFAHFHDYPNLHERDLLPFPNLRQCGAVSSVRDWTPQLTC
jgi:hypothetical protein